MTIKQDRPLPCAGTCGRMIRPHHTTAERWPNTTRWHGSGMCRRCHEQRDTPAPKPMFRDCESCGALTRPKGHSAAKAPARSRQRIGELCMTCYNDSPNIATPAQVEQMRLGVIAYLRWRGRPIPTELLKEAS